MYTETNDANKETEETPRRSSKVMIAEASTNVAPRPAIETFRKSLLKSTSSSSIDKQGVLDVKATEVRSPSPIPEDLVGEEISKQSVSSATIDQEKKIEEKKNAQEQQQEKGGETSEKETLEEQKVEEMDENNHEQSGNAECNNSDNTGQQTSETDKEIDAGKDAEFDAKESKPEVLPIQGTKLQGKSKATGRVMGGWI